MSREGETCSGASEWTYWLCQREANANAVFQRPTEHMWSCMPLSMHRARTVHGISHAAVHAPVHANVRRPAKPGIRWQIWQRAANERVTVHVA